MPRTRRTVTALGTLAAGVTILVMATGSGKAPAPGPARAVALPPAVIATQQVGPGPRVGLPPAAARAARRFARGRPGIVSFAAHSGGRRLCLECRRPVATASIAKVMLLAAELGRVRRARVELTAFERDLLARMVRESDNDAADLIYGRVGDAGLAAVARRAGMRDFMTGGYWANAHASALDLVRLFKRLPEVVPAGERRFAHRLLRTVVSWQRWGVPQAVGSRWRVLFKGGWRPNGAGHLVSQAARLERPGRTVTLAVLTDGNPSQEHGVATIRGVTARLLATP